MQGKCSDNMSPVVLIKAERNSFTLCGDLMDTAARVLQDYIPAAKDDNKVRCACDWEGSGLGPGLVRVARRWTADRGPVHTPGMAC